ELFLSCRAFSASSTAWGLLGMNPSTRTAATLCAAFFCCSPAARIGHAELVVLCASEEPLKTTNVRITPLSAATVQDFFEVRRITRPPFLFKPSHWLMQTVRQR